MLFHLDQELQSASEIFITLGKETHEKLASTILLKRNVCNFFQGFDGL